MQAYPVPQPAAAPVPTPKRRVWICDVSGSMAGSIKQMADDVIAQLKECDPADVLTILWFSSEGLRGVIVKGMIVGQNQAIIEKLIRQQMYSRNLTCFSESLHDTIGHIADLDAFGYPVSLFWFTDGHPVVSNYTRELDAIFRALGTLKVLVAKATIIGYGDYYNRDLLARMAQALGADFTHADDLVAFQKGLQAHIGGQAAPRVKLTVQPGHEFLFGLDTGAIVTYPVDATDNTALVSPVEQVVYGIGGPANGHRPALAEQYAAAYLYGHSGRVDAALEVLGREIGDKHLVETLGNAFTNTEIGAALAAVQGAVFDPTQRLLAGHKKNCTPKRDAFCLIEALELLAQDPEARFVPDAGFAYKRTGVATKTAVGYPPFMRELYQHAPFSLTWHNARLNVALLAHYSGTVALDDQAAAQGLANPLPCQQFRNYVIIKDGRLNVRILPVTLSRVTFMALQAGGLIKRTLKWDPASIYMLDLARIPIMNRALADGCSAVTLASLAIQELTDEVVLKVLKWRRNILDPDKAEVVTAYTPEQREYLKQFGIDYRGWYAPPVEKEEPDDYYEAHTFEVKIKGASSLPKVDEVIERQMAGKKLNQVQEMIFAATTAWGKDGLAEIDASIGKCKQRLAATRVQINRTRAAVILGNRWFPEFNNRDDNKLVDAKWEYVFALGTERVAY